MPSPKLRPASRTPSPSSSSAPIITVPLREGLPSLPCHSPLHPFPEASNPPKSSHPGDKNLPQRGFSKSPLGLRQLPPTRDDPYNSSSSTSSSFSPPLRYPSRPPPPIPDPVPPHQHHSRPPPPDSYSTSTTTEPQPYQPTPPSEVTPPHPYPKMDSYSTSTSSSFTSLPYVKHATPKEWPPPSYSSFVSTEECPQPRAFDWGTLIPAASLAMLAGIALTWALATPTQRAAMLSAGTYAIMLLCLVLPPFFL